MPKTRRPGRSVLTTSQASESQTTTDAAVTTTARPRLIRASSAVRERRITSAMPGRPPSTALTIRYPMGASESAAVTSAGISSAGGMLRDRNARMLDEAHVLEQLHRLLQRVELAEVHRGAVQGVERGQALLRLDAVGQRVLLGLVGVVRLRLDAEQVAD